MKKIKNALLYFILVIFKYHLKLFYFFIKLFTKQKQQVFFLSRQFNEIPLNYKLLMRDLDKEQIKYKYICKKVSGGLNSIIRNEKKKKNLLNEFSSIISYYFNIYKQMHYCATSKVIVVDGYNVSVSILKHKKNTKVIQLWHSLGAIKKFGYQTIGNVDGLNPKIAKILCMHKNYDFIVSGTNNMKQYFAEAFGTDISKTLELGTPSVDYLLNGNNSEVKSIYKKYPQLKKKINVLYSPTFRSDGTDDVENVIKTFRNSKYNLILTFHPKNKPIKNEKGIICVNRNEFLTFDILRVVDYVITDYSALSIDAAILGKKVMLYLYDYEKYSKENGLNLDLFKELKGNSFKNIDELFNVIDQDKYNEKSFKTFRKKYATFDNHNTESLIKLIKDILEHE